MANVHGLWISVGGGVLADRTSAAIRNNNQFTTSVSESDVKPRDAELVLVSLYGTSADYVGISRVGRLIVTGQVTLAVSNLIELKHLSMEVIREKLPPRLARGFVPPQSGVYRPTPRLWEELTDVVTQGISKRRDRIRDLGKIIDAARIRDRWIEGGLEVFERDAVASALQAWAGPSFRKKVLRSAVPGTGSSVAPFLSQLRDVAVREDAQINHDHALFPGMKLLRRAIVGSIVLHDGGEYLTILNCNRQPLERTLGVDLVYYSHRFDSFVLVQYKRMTQREYRSEYRPDADPNHKKELERMVAADRMLRAVGSHGTQQLNSFRLSDRAFYLKLCEPRAKRALDAGMVWGMYFPLGLWRRMLKAPEFRGKRGGLTVTFENSPRRLSNGEFTALLRHGWIGSAPGQSKRLSEIIREVLASRHMLMLAATSRGEPTKDYRRDDLGRFASEDDPFGEL
jgi:hypothetical protein